MNAFEVLETLLPRYVKSIKCDQKDGSNLEEEPCKLMRDLQKVPWMKNFFMLPGHKTFSSAFNISDEKRSTCGVDTIIKNGYYPMDVASGLAVHALLNGNNLDRIESIKVLDLCCCPGSKLHLIWSLLYDRTTMKSQQRQRPLIVGVDISPQRLFTCQSLLRKLISRNRYHNIDNANLGRIILLNCDGSCFGSDGSFGTVVFDSDTYADLIAHEKTGDLDNRRKKLNKSARARMRSACATIERQLQHQAAVGNSTGTTSNSKELASNGASNDFSCGVGDFDFVLVDAECRHDASYRHMSFIEEDDKEEGDELLTVSKDDGLRDDDDEHGEEPRHGTDVVSNKNYRYRCKKRKVAHLPSRNDDLTSLQLSLLRNGFRHLKVGGSLIYSTCSQDAAQNEDIVSAMLKEEPSAILVPAFPPSLFPTVERYAITTSSQVVDNDAIAGRECFATSASGNVRPFQAAAHELLNQNSLDGLLKQVVDLPEDQIHVYANEICDSVASSALPVFSEGHLPGTIILGFKGGMSGHFIAKITKKRP
eukprot:gene23670-32043_t